jgi:hypothetical protein
MAQPLIATVAKAKYIDEMMDNGQKAVLALYLLIGALFPRPFVHFDCLWFCRAR